MPARNRGAPAPALGSAPAALLIVALVFGFFSGAFAPPPTPGALAPGVPPPGFAAGEPVPLARALRGVADRAADAVYSGMRTLGHWQQVRRLGRQGIQTAHFQVWDRAGSLDVGSGDTSVLEETYLQVAADLGLEARGKIPLVVHPDQEAMEEYVGDLGERGASGAYWQGVIHLVGGIGTAAAAGVAGPLTHELTHYLLDYAAGRRVPVWFSEGLAQWEEYRLTGQKLYPFEAAKCDGVGSRKEPGCGGDPDRDEGCVDWQVLARFSTLSDEEAYGMSMAAVTLLYDRLGAEGIRQMVSTVAAGSSFEEAAEVVGGKTDFGRGGGGPELSGECKKGKVPAGRRLP